MCLFEGTSTVSSRDITVFVFEILDAKFAHMQSQWSLWVPGYTFGRKFWNLMGDATFGGNLPMASKNVKFTKKVQWSWKEMILNRMEQNVLVFDHLIEILSNCEAMYIKVLHLFNNFAMYNHCEQIWLIYLIPRTEPDWLPIFGHNLLRPTSINWNYTPWILRCLVPECPRSSAWFLTCPPPGVWAMIEPVYAWESLL